MVKKVKVQTNKSIYNYTPIPRQQLHFWQWQITAAIFSERESVEKIGNNWFVLPGCDRGDASFHVSKI